MPENLWSAVGNHTSTLGPPGSSFGPLSLAPVGIHQFLLSRGFYLTSVLGLVFFHTKPRDWLVETSPR